MTKKHSKLRYLVLLTISLLGLSACTIFTGKPLLNELSELQANEVILVGRIELVPPLAENEQYLKTLTSDRFLGTFSAVYADHFIDLSEPPLSTGQHAVIVTLEQNFFARQPASKDIIYSGGAIALRSTMQESVTYLFPGGLKYEVPSGARAIYLGTIRYHRDDYDAITKVELIDDFTSTNREFQERFGTSIKLHRVTPQKL